ncbi:MAG: methyltransferase domain-containing protein [Pseudomonadota bacterium]
MQGRAMLYEGMPIDEIQIDWRTRLIAWWEGFDLSGIEERKKNAKARLAEKKASKTIIKSEDAEPEAEKEPPGLDRNGRPLWSLTRIELAELMWGEKFVEPGSETWIPKLVATLPLNPTSSLLDLTAGLGGVIEHAAQRFGAHADGYDVNPLLVEEGNKRIATSDVAGKLQLNPLDQNNFQISRRYEFCLALNLFYTVEDKDALYQKLVTVLKDRGQLVFTDFFIQPDADITSGALKAWRQTERLEPHPITSKDMEKGLTAAGFDVRTVEDISTAYQREARVGLSRLHEYLKTKEMDGEAKQLVTDEIALLTRRLRAMEAGLKFKRIHAILPVGATSDDAFAPSAPSEIN